ncbi:MAG: hypothetical protein ACTJHW_03975 [Paenalcaligenes sp.]
MPVLQLEEVSNGSVFFASWQEQRALELKIDQINDVLAGRSATVWLRNIEYTPDDITQLIQEQLDGNNPPKSLLWDFFDSIDSEPLRDALRKRINDAVHGLATEAVDAMDAGEIRELIYG